MNKAIKVCLVIGIIFSLLGVGTLTTGVMMGGVNGLDSYFTSWGFTRYRHFQDSRTRNWNEELLARSDAAESTVPGNGGTEAGAFTGIQKLELEAGPYHTMILMEEKRENPSDDTIRIIRGDGSWYQYLIRQEGDTLEIRIPEPITRSMKLEALTILVPEGFVFREVEIDAKAGDFHAATIQADSLSLEADAGQITIEGGTVGRLEADCKAGNIVCMAKTTWDMEVDCAAGSVELALFGTKEDYNYELECKAGSILLAAEEEMEYSALSGKKRINNQANSNVEIDCKAGSVTVYYPDSAL